MKTSFFRFVIVGGIGFLVDGGGTWLLAHLGIPPLLARIPPLLTAIIVTWLLNRTLTFRTDQPRNRAELMRYATVALSSALVNFAIYSGLVGLGMNPFLSTATATMILLVYSFFAYRRMVFR